MTAKAKTSMTAPKPMTEVIDSSSMMRNAQIACNELVTLTKKDDQAHHAQEDSDNDFHYHLRSRLFSQVL